MLKRSVLSAALLGTFLAIGSLAQAQNDYGPGVSARPEKSRSAAAGDRASQANDAQVERNAEVQSRDGRDSEAAASTSQPKPRQRFHNGRRWYLTENNQWLIWDNGRWVPYQQPQYTQPQPQYYEGGNYQYGYQQPYGSRYGSGYRGNYNGGYYDQRYYGQGYYNGPGYGNRGWGNANYGNRGANQGSNIGGAIGQGLGGSGQIGAGIGAAIGNQ